RLLLERVQNIYLVSEPRRINDTICSRIDPDPDFLHTHTYIRHRLEIFRVVPVLHASELISSGLTGVPGKLADRSQRIAEEFDLFHGSIISISIYNASCRVNARA